MKDLIQSHLKRLISKKYPSFKGELVLEYPPDSKMGDLGFPCFELAKAVKKTPDKIANELLKEFKSSRLVGVDKVQVIGSYLNFFVSKESLWQEVFGVKRKLRASETFGLVEEGGASREVKPQASNVSSPKRIMVEFSSPNTNKPLHLGHVRNNVLGQSISNLLESQGHKVIRASLVNDRGVHICKSMLTYQKVKSGEWKFSKVSSDSNVSSNSRFKGDHLVGNYYVLYSQKEKENPELAREVQKLLKKWEAGDKKTLALWRKMNKMVLVGFDETYKKMGIKFDKVYFESKEYEQGRNIIKQMLKKGKCYKRKDGAIEIDLKKYGLDKKVLLRADGTSVYITQDIGLAVNRQKTLNLDQIIYVVACEQDYHFKVLFKILEIFSYKWAKNLYHLSYAMVNLPSGKMKSREGKVVDADDLMDEMIELAGKEIKKREPEISKKELKARAEKIGIGAMKFYLLKHSPGQTVLYNPQESISFEGATGPYVQYTYARIQSILKKSKVKSQKSKVKFSVLSNSEEREIGKLLARYDEVVSESTNEYNPAKLCVYLLDLASAFNTFYHQHPVLKAPRKDLVNARLALINSVAGILKAGLKLLGIEVVERM